MNYKSQLTKRIIKKLEKNGVKIIGTPEQTYYLFNNHIHAWGKENILGSPNAQLMFYTDNKVHSVEVIKFEKDGKILYGAVIFEESVSELVKKDTELEIYFVEDLRMGRDYLTVAKKYHFE
jgi:hypothetical protein